MIQSCVYPERGGSESFILPAIASRSVCDNRAAEARLENGGIRRARSFGVVSSKHVKSFQLYASSVYSLYDHKFGNSLADDDDAQNADEPERIGTASVDRPSTAPAGKLGSVGLAIAIFKGNCCSAILFMPHAYSEGGFVFAPCAMPLICALTLVGALLLIQSRRLHAGQSYGDLMERAVGKWGRISVDISVVMLQTGTCCSYFISVSQMLQRTVLPNVDTLALMAGQCLILAPLVWIRKVAWLWPLNMLGSILVISGIAVATGIAALQISQHGGEWSTLQPISGSGSLVFIGTACFSFEGIGLLLPLYDSAADQDRFSMIYASVFAFLCVLISCMGILGSGAYGAQVKPLVLLSMPDGAVPTVLQLAYCVAMLCTFPLQFLPAVRLIENIGFTPMSSPPFSRKLKKSLLRTVVMITAGGVAYAGSNSLAHFVSLVGAVCGLPLAFVYPAVCHLRLRAHSVAQKLVDWAFIVIGTAMTFIIAGANIANWNSA